jgi:serine/threonine-protein kinase
VKRCPFCAEEIRDAAVVCRYCQREIGAGPGPPGGAACGLDDLRTVMGLAPGTRLASRYRIERPLGEGGIGQVYLAEDEVLTRPGDPVLVAITIVSPLLGKDRGALERLKDEACAAIRLTHLNIVRVNSFEDGGSLKFLVMEYVEGESLKDRLGRENRLPEDEVRRIGIALCGALAHAHEKSVLHRDVKPANVLPGKDGSVKPADFGIARVSRDSVSRLTGVVTSGTLLYMAPEQVRGKPATALSDL